MSEPRVWDHALPGGGVVYSATIDRRDPKARVARVVVPTGYKSKAPASFEDQCRDYVNLPPIARIY